MVSHMSHINNQPITLPGSMPSAAEPTTFYSLGGITYNVSLAYFVVSSFFFGCVLRLFGGMNT